MGVRIISNTDTACLYDSSTDRAFGPVAHGEEAHAMLDGFLRWLPRESFLYSEDEIIQKWSEYQAKAYECQDCYQWVAGDGGPQKDKDGNVVCQRCYEQYLEAVREEQVQTERGE